MRVLSVETFEVGPMGNNVYLLADEATRECAVVDPGIESEPVLDQVRARGWRLRYVINTHGHFDHAFRDAWFMAETGAELLLHAEDAPLLALMPQQAAWFGFPAPAVPVPTRLLRDGDVVAIGGVSLKVLHTPGHTPGGICLLAEGESARLFSGDTLFAGSIGRTDLPGGDHQTLLRSIREKLLTLPDDTEVYPGHGPASTIGQERVMNPFLAGGVQ